jgi:hypothetical protein
MGFYLRPFQPTGPSGDGRRMRRNGARIDQEVCIASRASQCRTVDQVVVLPDGVDAKA